MPGDVSTRRKEEDKKLTKISFDPLSKEIVDTALRLDLVVDNRIIVELKSLENVSNAHTAQILTYMKTSGIKTGLLINFGEPYFKKAIKRFVL